jgi:CheY-like chemotaxis protein
MGLVLVIDDSLEIRSMVLAMVKDLGLEAIAARDGAEGLRLVRKFRPDLVISDIGMPRMDGIRLFKTIQGEDGLAHLPWVMMSSPDKEKDALKAGCVYFLPKPFDFDDLAGALHRALS